MTLTRREEFAKAIAVSTLQGAGYSARSIPAANMAECIVGLADALIAELDKTLKPSCAHVGKSTWNTEWDKCDTCGELIKYVHPSMPKRRDS